jgi:hypothetical protein
VSAGQTAQFNLQAMPGPGMQRVAGVRVFGSADGSELQRAGRGRVEWNAREFHGDSDDQRQRHGCANGSTNNSFEAV